MAEPPAKKTHLDNLKDIVSCLAWWINYDTILTELPYDLEYLVVTDMEKFVDYCRKVCSKDELDDGRFPVNRPVVEHFVKVTFPYLDLKNRNEKVDQVMKEIHEVMKMPQDGPVTMSHETVERILEGMQKLSGEGPLDKVKKRIKVAVALQWLQDPQLLARLTQPTRDYIRKVGDHYGRHKRGERVHAKTIGTYNVPDEDLLILDEFHSSQLSLAILVAANDIDKAKEKMEPGASEFKQFGVIIDAVKRLKEYVEGKRDAAYDQIERFKDTVFIAIIINYLQDPYIKKTEEISKLVKWIVPLYNQYKTIARAKAAGKK